MIENRYLDLELEDRNNYVVSIGYKHWDSKDSYSHLVWLKDTFIKKLLELFGISIYKNKHGREEKLWIVKKLEGVDIVLELLASLISLQVFLCQSKLKELKRRLITTLKKY